MNLSDFVINSRHCRIIVSNLSFSHKLLRIIDVILIIMNSLLRIYVLLCFYCEYCVVAVHVVSSNT